MTNSFKRVFRIVWLVVAAVATILTFTDHIAAFNGDGHPVTLYFTTWSVWFSLASALCIFIVSEKKLVQNNAVMVLKFSANILMIATFVVSAFVLPDKIWMKDYWTLGSTFKHFLLPIITIADTCLFDEKNYKVWFPFAGVVVPVIYWFLVILRAVTFRNANGGMIPVAIQDDYYPYGFTNLDANHTLGGLIRLLMIIGVSLIVVGYVFYFIKREKKSNAE